jgi:hypothetical protein
MKKKPIKSSPPWIRRGMNSEQLAGKKGEVDLQSEQH